MVRIQKSTQKQCPHQHHTTEGSIIIGLMILFLFLGALLSIHMRNAVFFSSCMLKKQQALITFYETDALLQYGIAYASDHYEDMVTMTRPVVLRLAVWPPGGTSDSQAALIAINRHKQDHTLEIMASLGASKKSYPLLSCLMTKEGEEGMPSMITIASWAFDTKNEALSAML